MRNVISLTVTADDRSRLEAIVADCNTPRKHVWRARIVLLTAAEAGTNTIMRKAGVSKTAVWRWQGRFMHEGVDGLLRDKARPPGRPPMEAERVAAVVRLTQSEPPHEATHWTARAMASTSGLAVSTVQEIWKKHGLARHRWRTFKVSTDPAFVPKLHDVVGLYVDPPARAIVLSVDEKSQIQALDRIQPGLSMKVGRPATRTHDYERHGTTTLFAALNVLDGTVIGRNMQRHRHQEFIRFLNVVEAAVPAGKVVHAILDDYAVHKHPRVHQWLERHPRWVFHFTPTSPSWLNTVEGFFTKLAKRHLRRGVFRSVVDLQAAINRFIVEHDHSPKPFVWRADPDAIIAAAFGGCMPFAPHHEAPTAEMIRRKFARDIEAFGCTPPSRPVRTLGGRAEVGAGSDDGLKAVRALAGGCVATCCCQSSVTFIANLSGGQVTVAVMVS